MVSVALAKGIARRVFLPTIAERSPFLGNHPICALPMLHAFATTPPQSMQQAQHTRREGASHRSNEVSIHQVSLTRLSNQVLRPLGISLPSRQAMYACDGETGCGFFVGACAPANGTAYFSDPPPTPPAQKNRSPGDEAPARSGSRAALSWTALWPGVDVNHHPSRARTSLAGHPHIPLRVVHASLDASQASALLIGTRFCSGHDHAIISSTSWS
jgi:hypothetical protein